MGFEVDLADALAEFVSRRAGKPIRFEFKQYEWDSLPLGLGRKDFDLIISGFEIDSREPIALPFHATVLSLLAAARRPSRELADRVAGGLPGQGCGNAAGSAAEQLLCRARH